LKLRYERFLQHQAGAVEAHLNGCGRDAQSFCGLLHVAILELAENEDFAIGERKRYESAANERSDLLALKGIGGNFAPIGELHGCDFSLAVVVERVGEPWLRATETATGLIEDDTDEPGAEACFGTKSIKVAIGLEEGFLCGVFSFGLVVKHGESHEVDAALIGTDELVEDIVVAIEDRRDHRGLVLLANR
jgi:hypothetical protein